MTIREDFMEWAITQGYDVHSVKPDGRFWSSHTHRAFEAFAAGQRAEREACLTICEELEEYWSGYKDTALLNGDWQLSNAASGEPRAAEAIAAVIRSRNSLDKP